MGILPALISGGATIGSSLLGAFGGDDGGDAADVARLSKKSMSYGLNELVKLLQSGPGEFVPEDQPGYKYGFEEFVRKPMDRGASARGRYFSPGTTEAIGRSAQDYASTQYDNFLNRYYKKLEPYFSMMGMGGTAMGYRDTSGTDRTNALMAGVGGVSNIINKYLDRPQVAPQAPPTPYSGGNALRIPAGRWSPR
jgi:hypothetical protein